MFFFSVPGPEVGPGQYTGPAEQAESIEGGNRDPPPYSSLFPEIQADKKQTKKTDIVAQLIMDPSKLDEGPKLWPDGSSSSSSGRGIMTGKKQKIEH